MLYLIGLGIGNEKDLTLRSLETIKKCSDVYLENYTSPYLGSLKKLEKTIGKKITLANRKLVETQSQTILDRAKKKHVAFLVVGDVFAATTHTDLLLRAREQNITVKTIHNTSILTAIGDTGLSLYKFGKVTSIPYLTKGWHVDSPYNALKENLSLGLHTLFLLDLKPEEKKFMTAAEALTFLWTIEERRKEKILTEETIVISCAALGTDRAQISAGTLESLKKHPLKGYPQCLLIPGKLHFLEEEALKQYMQA